MNYDRRRLSMLLSLVNIQNKEEEKKSPSPRRRQAMSVER
jgi:hypothetical protein